MSNQDIKEFNKLCKAKKVKVKYNTRNSKKLTLEQKAKILKNFR